MHPAQVKLSYEIIARLRQHDLDEIDELFLQRTERRLRDRAAGASCFNRLKIMLHQHGMTLADFHNGQIHASAGKGRCKNCGKDKK